MRSGKAVCSICELPINPRAKWHLHHNPDGSYAGPAHPNCNTTQPHTRTARRLQRGDYPADDPEHRIFWGPPSEWDGKPRRWSRLWFPWRDDPSFR